MNDFAVWHQEGHPAIYKPPFTIKHQPANQC